MPFFKSLQFEESILYLHSLMPSSRITWESSTLLHVAGGLPWVRSSLASPLFKALTLNLSSSRALRNGAHRVRVQAPSGTQPLRFVWEQFSEGTTQ